MEMDFPHTVFLPGFNLENFYRNKKLEEEGFQPPKPFTTGTTIVGVIFKDGVVLGSDTRTTDGNTVCDKNSQKIHRLADNIYCCGSGNAADAEMVSSLVATHLDLMRLNIRRQCQVTMAVTILKRTLYPTRGKVCSSLIVGGVDKLGTHLCGVYAHGSSDVLQYISFGSGQAPAMGVLEAGWVPNMSEEDAKVLVGDAVSAGVLNDLASGSSVDLCVVRRATQEYLRGYKKFGQTRKKPETIDIQPGTTKVHKTTVKYFK